MDMNTSVDAASDRGVVIVGGGPAGLTAAHELTSRSLRPIVLEMSEHVGGIARTENYKGFRFDIGGHRFFTKVAPIRELWHEVMGSDFIRVRRLSRIYYRGKFFSYPLRIPNTLKNLGLYESVRILLSYFKWQTMPHEIEENFEQWVTNRFGRRLFLHFFQGYTEKVWGIPCSKIRADWAAQRIQNLSLYRAAINAMTGRHDTSTLITEFFYPRLGPGMMWERFRDIIEERGGTVQLRSRVKGLVHERGRVQSVVIEQDGKTSRLECSHVISTMPLATLIQQLYPAPPAYVQDAANQLKYRDFLIVVLILDIPDPFPDNWIYIHSSDVNVGRIQNFRSWSAEMIPDPNKSSIGMEYFCNENDGLWAMPDMELIEMAKHEIAHLGLAEERTVIDATVIRQPKAYPVYDEHYSEAVDIIRSYLGSFSNLQTIGRNGMHRYNNQDHSMLTAILAARNVFGARHDVWNVNIERSYHEEFTTTHHDDSGSGHATADSGRLKQA